MKINSIRLINFRNIVKAELDFNSAFNFFVLYGDNGAGKTSVLEAISLLNSSKGMLKAKLADIINFKTKDFGIFAQLNEETTVKLTYKENKKEFFIDNEKLSRLSQLSSLGNVCWVTPSSDRLFYDSKKPRRDFFDRLVYALDNNLAKNTNNYNYLIQSRIKLLQDPSTDLVWVDKIEDEISNLAISILKSRSIYLAKLNNVLLNYDLTLSYTGVVEKQFKQAINELNFDNLTNDYKDILKNSRVKDAKFNSTSFGIHKTDILAYRPSTELKVESSSMGQHKKALIDLIIGHVKLIKENENSSICLLIDELTSHLDETNKEYLFKNLEQLNVQTFLTGTRKENFDIIKEKSNFIHIKNGTIIS